MAESIKEYWKNLRRIAAKLDPEAAELDAAEEDKESRVHLEKSGKEIWLISTANDEQVAAHKAELARRKEVIEREEADRKGVPTSKLLEALVAAQQPAGGKGKRAE